jgi:hypothetical protein
MLGVVTPDLAELARHIVAISDFWLRSDARAVNDGGFRAIKTMIETSIGPDDGERICRAVVRELETLQNVSLGDPEATLGFKADCIVTLLAQEYGQRWNVITTSAQLRCGAVRCGGSEQSGISA